MNYSDASRAAQAKQAWELGISILRQSGMSDPQARRFFGKLLSTNKLTGDQMLQPCLRCEVLASGDPASYLTRAAASVHSRQQQPALLALWT